MANNASAVTLFNDVINMEDARSIITELQEKYSDHEYVSNRVAIDKIEHPTDDVIRKKIAALAMRDITDWTIDDSKRFSSAYYLKGGNVTEMS